MNIRKRKKQHGSTPPTKSRWFEDNDWLDEIDDNLLKDTLATSVPETALSVQSFFERLDGDEPPSG